MKYRTRVAAIIRENDKILLVKHRHPVSGFEWWVPPGGGLEQFDRDIYQCAVRETWEETGYSIRTDEIIYLREFVDLENNTHNTEIFLRGEIIGGELTFENVQGNGPDEHYIRDVCWIDKQDVQSLVVFPQIIKEDVFWKDIEGTGYTRYLGRQEG